MICQLKLFIGSVLYRSHFNLKRQQLEIGLKFGKGFAKCNIFVKVALNLNNLI